MNGKALLWADGIIKIHDKKDHHVSGYVQFLNPEDWFVTATDLGTILDTHHAMERMQRLVDLHPRLTVAIKHL
jgi:hypothetical protein